MGRPRGFDEEEVVQTAVALFAERSYDGISVDDLVGHLGVHRNSLYKTFGSKRGLYLAALRWHLEHQAYPLVDVIGQAADVADALDRALGAKAGGAGLDLLLLAAVERAPVDSEVAALVGKALADLDTAVGRALSNGESVADGDPPATALAAAVTAAVLGLRLRARAGSSPTQITEAGTALADRLGRHPS